MTEFPGNPGATPLEEWREQLRLQSASRKAKFLDRHLLYDDLPYDFASNDYLALNASGRISALAHQSLRIWHTRNQGLGSTGSRLIRGHHPVFEEAEETFRAYVNQPSALLFHSGYAANTGAVGAVMGPGDTAICDRLSHASLLDGVRLSGARRLFFPHNDLESLENRLAKGKWGRGRIWIVTEALFSMDGDSPDLRAMADLAERYGALIYLDEAHSIGVMGPEGAGLAAECGVSDRIAVSVYPLGKAPGIMGAFVCGSPELKDTLVNRARSFLFSTAQPPFMAVLADMVVRLLRTPDMDEERKRLRSLHTGFRNNLKERGLATGLSTSHIVPFHTGEDDEALRLMKSCREMGWDIRAIRPPTVPRGTSRLRINIHANHTEEILGRLAGFLAEQSGGG